MELSERDKCSSDQKSTEHHGSSGLWSSPMAEAAFPAMNMPSCRTHPNASHLASGSAFVSRAFSPFSTIDVDMVDQDKSTLQGLAAKKKKKNSSEIQELEDERRRGEAAMAADSKESVDTTQQTEAAKEDYIHVRARRGQATNSHSLAERVRREKISQRMKFLQELVPGCSKVTGKAVMLDEIINYVQSLQRQVEFLSMKLATVNPRMDFSIEALLSKDQFLQSQSGPSSSAIGFSPDIVHAKVDPSRRGLVRSGLSASLSTANAQFNSVPNAWEEQLQSAMQMACFSNNTHLPRTQ